MYIPNIFTIILPFLCKKNDTRHRWMEHRDGKDKPVRETKLKRKNVKTKGKFPKNTRINLEKLYFYRRNVKKV